MKKKLVSVSILTCNELKDLKVCLKCVFAQDYKNLEVLVIDNGSTDGTKEFISSTYKNNLTYIYNETNKGCAGGNNVGIKNSKGDYIIICDANLFMAKDYISQMVKAVENSVNTRIGMAQAKLFRISSGEALKAPELLKIIDSTGVFITRERRNFDRGAGETDRGQFDEAEVIFGAGGAAPLYKKEMLDEIKIGEEYFDEDFFIYREEIDFNWRANNFGWECLYVPEAVGYHIRTYSPQNRSEVSKFFRKLQFRNRYFMILKNDKPAEILKNLPFIATFEILSFGYILIKEQFLLKAYLETFAKIPKMLKKRKMIKNKNSLIDKNKK